VAAVGGGDWFLSVVSNPAAAVLGRPDATDWLRRFRAIFVGGGPAWPELLERRLTPAFRLPRGYA